MTLLYRLMDSIYYDSTDLHENRDGNHDIVTLSYQHVIFPFLLLGWVVVFCIGLMTVEKLINNWKKLSIKLLTLC